ncbi:Bifunctional transcriptional activator/DNA repair enzyme Ada [Pedobacter sp. Bi27]|uniref:methylated-DNA--[protein]-cysteine S-methyltransferase n=1 Tax=unclassified Pedobacter TaxID=2628915 RepID=UPI001D733243|nr:MULTISPECIES: methylated-DNA--[protein]-cysteine S-methyltransferase [unclassified Pedobacter]CAH0161849.1 Bifunctional transcriptional activator/DNA repair enzyme Ada [Pedobacter sp. Bi126]CAH0162398.1 Bifunctional transcriptional activator/DNA repair enzyme Ada [Pedobacter sp. Bi27]CAH0281075.1 Bifunctional transcriptional activator/DNA repair enzyme Ada [Pedobacter sp. Bi36]
MKAQEEINFNRIAEAISYIKANFKTQPGLEEIAEKVNLSPFHFQRLFSEWAGTTPKRFLQYISIGYAKEMLKENQSLFDTALETGLSGTSRLHDLFVNIEGMTPGEYKNGGENLHINYSFAESPFGNIIVASTSKGICHIAFYDDENIALANLQRQFPAAQYQQILDKEQQNALFIFSHDWSKLHQIKLHLKGTDFQLKVWEALLKIPMGKLATYGNIAKQLQNPNASRAVGTAIGDNPVAFLIPCHRVIQTSGALGGYHWGVNRKTAMIGWEAAKTNA